MASIAAAPICARETLRAELNSERACARPVRRFLHAYEARLSVLDARVTTLAEIEVLKWVASRTFPALEVRRYFEAADDFVLLDSENGNNSGRSVGRVEALEWLNARGELPVYCYAMDSIGTLWFGVPNPSGSEVAV